MSKTKMTLHETKRPHARTTSHGTKPSNVLRSSKKRRGSKRPRERPLRTRTHLHPRSLRCCLLPPRRRPAPLPAETPARLLRLRHWPHWTPAPPPALPSCWPQHWLEPRRWSLRLRCAVRAAPPQREAAQGLRSTVLCVSASSIRRSLPLEFPAGGCRVSQAYHFAPRNTTPKS